MLTSAIHGGLFTSLSHGVLGAGAFALVGLPSPLMLGVAVAITAFVPAIGSLLVWVPAILYLAFTEHLEKAAILAGIGGVGVIVIDYVLRSIFIRGGMQLPFLLVFFGAFGGLEVFGLMGIVLGPLILATFVSLINFTRQIPDKHLRAQPPPPLREQDVTK